MNVYYGIEPSQCLMNKIPYIASVALENFMQALWSDLVPIQKSLYTQIFKKVQGIIISSKILNLPSQQTESAKNAEVKENSRRVVNNYSLLPEKSLSSCHCEEKLAFLSLKLRLSAILWSNSPL